MKVCSENQKFLYSQARDWLVQQMRTGKLMPGSKLPGERALAELLKISRGTARVALQELEQEGLIDRIPSRGAFIKKADETRQLKLALVFPEADISREHLTYANWLSCWGQQQGLLNSCAKHNSYLSFVYCNPDKCIGNNGKHFVEQFCSRLTSEFDGVVFMSQQLPELKQLLIDSNFPFISIIDEDLLPGEKSITYNRKEICQEIANSIVSSNYQRITMLVDSFHNSTWNIKYKAIEDVLTHANIPFSMSNVLQTSNNEEKTFKSLKDSYQCTSDLPDVFICTTQIHSLALLQMANRMRWLIPDDFTFVGYGHTPDITCYPAIREISYVQIPYLELGTLAVDLLTKKIISNNDIPDMTTVPAKLITEKAKHFSL